MKAKEIVKALKEGHNLNSAADLLILDMIEDQLLLIEKCDEELRKYAKENNTAEGILIFRKSPIQHPNYKIKSECQKTILSCMRQLEIKDSSEKVEKSTKPKALESLMKKVS